MSLTKYPEGSVRELLGVAFPLMLSSLSVLAMVFVDRLFLAHYSPAAMSAAVTAGTTSWAILGSLVILGSMAEVFVAQYNGAGKLDRIGRPVWQMTWFSVATIAVLVPIAIWGGGLLFGRNENFALENEYFFWLTLFGWAWPLVAALSAFYVGRGKTRLVMLIALGANGVNILLDWILIFGVEGLVPSMGVAGAAIATSFGNVIQIFVFLPLFLTKKHREQFGTGRFGLHLKEMGRCLRVGGPPSLLFLVELLGWGFFYMMIARTGPGQIFVAGIGQSVLILFFFVAEGIGRGASALAGNLLGGGRPKETYKVLRAGFKLHLVFFAIASLAFVVYPQVFIDLFMGEGFLPFMDSGTEVATLQMAELSHTLVVVLRLCLFYLLFEGLRWLASGLLTSAGDTMFLLVAGIVTVPLTLLIPAYYVVVKLQLGAGGAFCVSVFFAFTTASVFLFRLMGSRWHARELVNS